LILDFDGTITTADTTALLADISRRILPRPERIKSEKLWEHCLAEYSSALENHPSIKSLKEKRHTIDDEIAYQRGLRFIEEESVSRCGESGILKGISAMAWRETGQRACSDSRVRLMPGLQAMVQKVQIRTGGTGRWGVVSVNWSRDFIKGVLDFALGGTMKSERVPVLSNHIIQETGFIEGPMFGPTPSLSLARTEQPVSNPWTKVFKWRYKELQVWT
jgi:thiamine phosphate phosphatase / amino-HMP aminohydrolase